METKTSGKRLEMPACCGKPLVNTMIFSGAEYFCPDCKGTYGIFCSPEKVERNDANEKLQEERQETFNEMRKDCIPYGAQRIDCDKCKGRETHRQHATPEELAASDAAYAKLLGRDE
jgi:hypothetical protein